MEEPAGITFEVPNPNQIIVKGIDKGAGYARKFPPPPQAVIVTYQPPAVRPAISRFYMLF